jgi:DNA helicase-2/ATP-dependent DNA helicase PcrA
VFLVSLVNGRFPWPRRSQPIEVPDCLIKEVLPEGDFHIQEERRLFYVGMTRAKEELYLTSASDCGGKRLRKVSQFVNEALGKEAEPKEKKKASALETIQRFAPKKDSAKTPPSAIPEDKLIRLSYYHIDDYLTCPLKYKYVNILRLPIMEHHTVIYGRAMHEAVTRYFQSQLAGKKMELGGLLSVFKESFDPQGFLDEKHQEERFRCGNEALAKFFAAEEKRRQLSISLPIYMEKEFSFMLEDNKVSGRFDRIDREGDGIAVMDFKTSRVDTQKDADERVKKSLQLKLYALACSHIPEFSRTPVKRAALYFLESGIIGSTAIAEKDLEEAKEKIRQVSAGIRSRQFPAQPGYKSCTYCAYNQVCPAAETS